MAIDDFYRQKDTVRQPRLVSPMTTVTVMTRWTICSLFIAEQGRHTTKHYYANGQRLATRVDGELYYTHTDSSGQSATFSDANGELAGQIFYDPLGEVIASTISSHLSQALAGSLEPEIGLQFDGSRFYDPLVGGYAQPNSFGSLFGRPQTLNRYTAGSISIFTLSSNLLSVSFNKTLGYYTDLTRYVSTRRFHGWERRSSQQRFWQLSSRTSKWGRLSIEAAPATLRRLSLSDFFEKNQNVSSPGGNRTAFVTRELVEEVNTNVYRTQSGALIDMSTALKSSTARWLQVSSFTRNQLPMRLYYRNRTVVAPIWRELPAVVKFGLKNSLPFGIDAAFQLATDWNTDMPFGYRIGRVGIAGGVGLLAGGLSTIGLTALLGTTPPGWAVIGVGVVTGIFVEPHISEWLFDETGLVPTKERKYE